jgi:hypothetical protein
MLLRLAVALVCLSGPVAAGVCVTNGTGHTAFFVADANGAGQHDGDLAPGMTLCSDPGDGSGGAVRVFENRDAFEGCSRLVQDGATETLIRYVDFDRCQWSSHGH